MTNKIEKSIKRVINFTRFFNSQCNVSIFMEAESHIIYQVVLMCIPEFEDADEA